MRLGKVSRLGGNFWPMPPSRPREVRPRRLANGPQRQSDLSAPPKALQRGCHGCHIDRLLQAIAVPSWVSQIDQTSRDRPLLGVLGLDERRARISGQRRIDDIRAPMAIARRDKRRRHVIAEQRNVGRV